MPMVIYVHTPFTVPSPGSMGCSHDVISGVTVGCLSFSLLLATVASVVIFVFTRRCYKMSSPPSPDENIVCYETVQLDSVQMQPSPAYQSVVLK